MRVKYFLNKVEMRISIQLMKQIASYGIIGVISSGVDAVLFATFVYVWGWFPFVANVLSVSVGITISFILNRKFTFKITDYTICRYLLFFGVGMIGLCISEAILFGGQLMSMNAMLTKLVSIVLVAIVQFILNKLISFKPLS